MKREREREDLIHLTLAKIVFFQLGLVFRLSMEMISPSFKKRRRKRKKGNREREKERKKLKETINLTQVRVNPRPESLIGKVSKL